MFFWVLSGAEASDDFSFQECNLYDVIRERRVAFTEGDIRNFMLQILQGLAHMHKNGYFHRDLKPGNFACPSYVGFFLCTLKYNFLFWLIRKLAGVKWYY
jgi:hypothetical protein